MGSARRGRPRRAIAEVAKPKEQAPEIGGLKLPGGETRWRTGNPGTSGECRRYSSPRPAGAVHAPANLGPELLQTDVYLTGKLTDS